MNACYSILDGIALYTVESVAYPKNERMHRFAVFGLDGYVIHRSELVKTGKAAAAQGQRYIDAMTFEVTAQALLDRLQSKYTRLLEQLTV